MPKKVVKKAGCVPVRRHEGKPDGDWEVLLVSSRQTSNTWVFPKGGVEKDEKHKDAAARETEEEAGVVGDMTKGSLGKFEYSRGGNLIRQKMWLLFVTRQHSDDSKRWKERKKRGREWMSFSDARVRLVQGDLNGTRPELISILDAAVARLERLSTDPNGVADDDDDDDDDGEEEQQQEGTSE